MATFKHLRNFLFGARTSLVPKWLSMRHAWRVGAAVAVLIGVSGLSAAQAAGKVTLHLRAFKGGPILKAGSEIDVVFYLGNENGGCFQGWSATVATNEATKDTLTKSGALEVSCEHAENREYGVALSGSISQLQLTTLGKLTTKTSKLALTETFCAAIGCKFTYNCVYALSKPSLTVPIPGGLEDLPFTVNGKLHTKGSGAECATEEAFDDSGLVEVREPGKTAVQEEPVWAEDAP